MNDIYQERYLAHQAKKKDILVKIMKKRYSERIFSEKPIEQEKVDQILASQKWCPSSCNRQAISIRLVDDRDRKALLGGLLVGGTGWIHRAPIVLLLFADPIAYKAGDEIDYMPYLDAGTVIQQFLLMATSLGLKSAYANPNIREFNKDHFHKIFGEGIFCGAVAIGYK